MTPNISIVAVHGLNPRITDEAKHAWDTWRKPAGESGRLWLKKDLPEEAPQARVFLYEYNSKVVYGADKGRFVEKANDLLEVLRLDRRRVPETLSIDKGDRLKRSRIVRDL